MKVYICARKHRTTYKLNQKEKKVAGKREVRIIAYTSKHNKQCATPSRIEEETLMRPFLSRSRMKCDAMQRMKDLKARRVDEDKKIQSSRQRDKDKSEK